VSRDPAEIEREIERTRGELAQTVDELVDRVSPGRVAQRGADRLRHRLREAAVTANAKAYDLAHSEKATSIAHSVSGLLPSRDGSRGGGALVPWRAGAGRSGARRVTGGSEPAEVSSTESLPVDGLSGPHLIAAGSTTDDPSRLGPHGAPAGRDPHNVMGIWGAAREGDWDPPKTEATPLRPVLAATHNISPEDAVRQGVPEGYPYRDRDGIRIAHAAPPQIRRVVRWDRVALVVAVVAFVVWRVGRHNDD
jgi:hypothetical protein